jgi:hypothetical protein
MYGKSDAALNEYILTNEITPEMKARREKSIRYVCPRDNSILFLCRIILRQNPHTAAATNARARYTWYPMK